MEKKDVFRKLAELGHSEDRVAVATIVRAYGSTPREVGAKMVILENGDFFGTVGGGCGEAEVWLEAQQVLSRGKPGKVHVDLTEDPDTGGDKVCGGKMDIFIDLWRRDDLVAASHIVDLLDRGEGVSLATVLDTPGVSAGAGSLSSAVLPPAGTRMYVMARTGTTRGSLGDPALDRVLVHEAMECQRGRRSLITAVPVDASLPPQTPAPRHGMDDALKVFVEILEQPPVLVIAGAGHCALPLSRMGKMVGFHIVILDDRPQCATRERFPDADRILLGDLEEQVGYIPMDTQTYVVLVTRGHRLDEIILRRIIREPLAYIGMIGSKRRIQAVFRGMERDGFEADYLDKVFSPIGLDIGAETPEEIAVAILAEIIRVRKGGSAKHMSLRALRSLRR